MIRAAVLLLLLPTLALAAPVPKAPVIDIRDPDGKVVLAAGDLESFDWATPR